MANIQQRSETTWCLTVYTGLGANGKYGRKTKTVKVTDPALLKTKKKLQDYLDDEYSKFRQEVMAGEYIAPEKMTFEAFVGEWRDKYGAKHLEASTLEKYEYQFKNHILPVFSHFKLSDIKPLQVLGFMEKLQQDGARLDGKSGGLSSTSARFIHRILKDVFDRAVEWKVIPSNPAAAVKRPKIAKKVTNVWSEQEASEMFSALEREPYMWRVMITLALTTGLRRGELLALEWKHIDLVNGTLDVRQALSFAKGKHFIKEPKTATSIRRVSLPTSIVSELKSYHLHCRKERLAMGDAWEGGEHFFLFSATSGKHLFHTVPGTWLRRFIKRNKLQSIRFHDLRHTSATLLINQGVHAKTIAARLGHADIRTTMNTYGHALQSADQAAADKFDTLFSKKSNSV